MHDLFSPSDVPTAAASAENEAAAAAAATVDGHQLTVAMSPVVRLTARHRIPLG